MKKGLFYNALSLTREGGILIIPNNFDVFEKRRHIASITPKKIKEFSRC
jgi:hypothetical protein